MNLKTIVLAGVTALSLAAPAAAFAAPDWGRDHGYREDWRRREAYDHRAYGYRYDYAPRCFIEDRGYRNWRGDYVSRPVRVCR